MKIKNIEVDIEQAIEYSNYKNILLKHRNNNILLSDYQCEILKKNGFDINQYGNIHELLFDVEEYLNNEYDDELDLISSQLAELIYYKDTKK